MSSASIRLAARGEQDLWLTGTPKQTYFLALYRKREPYVLESYEVPFDTSNVFFGSTVTCTLPTKGDLVQKMTLKCTLPALFYRKPGWCYPVTSTTFQPYIYLLDSSGNVLEILQVRSNQPFYSSAVLTWVPVSAYLTAVAYNGVDRLTYTLAASVARIGFVATETSFFGFDDKLGTKLGTTGIVTYAATTTLQAPFTLEQSGWVPGFTPPVGLSYIDSVGTYVIRTAEFLVGGQTVDVVTGEYIDIRQDLEVQYENQAALLLLNGKGDTSAIQLARTYYVTLPFTPEMALPIRDLYKQDVKVRVTFEQFSRLTATDVPLSGYGFLNSASSTVSSVLPALYSNTAVFDGTYIYVFSYNMFGLVNPRVPFVAPTLLQMGDVSPNAQFEASFVINGEVFAVSTDQYIVSVPVITTQTLSSFLTSSYVVFPAGIPRRAACTDGRYIYAYAGSNDSAAAYNTVYRFDTQSLATDTIDLKVTGVVAVNINLQVAPTFDGRYVYFADKYQNTLIIRYDTNAAFTTAGSWTVFNYNSVLSLSQQNLSASTFDGRYVYWLSDVTTSRWIRYDTRGTFATAGAWQVFDISTVYSGATTAGFKSPVFDGQYITVSGNGIFLRYNTALSFTTVSSYEWFNYTTGATSAGPRTAVVTSGAFNINVFDGRYIYSFPYGTPNVLRQDTSVAITPSSLQASMIIDYARLPERSEIKPQEFIVTQTSLTQSPNARFALEIAGPVKELFMVNQTLTTSGPYVYNPLTPIELKFNDEKVFDWTARQIEPFRFHSTMPQRTMSLVSFSQDPESNTRIAGSVNLARMRDIQVSVGASANTVTRVYARTYNVFRVENGIGGLRFMSPSFKTMFQPDNRWVYTSTATIATVGAQPLSGNVLATVGIGGIGATTGTLEASPTTPPQKIVFDSSGNFYVGGTFQGNDIQFGNSPLFTWYGGAPDSYLAVYDRTSTLASTVVLTTLGAGGVTINALAVQGTSVYVVGTFTTTAYFVSVDGNATTLTAGSGTNMFVAKYGAFGQYTTWVTKAGNNCTGLAATTDSEGVYITGNFTGTTAFYNANGTTTSSLTAVGARDGYVAKYSHTGTALWVAKIGVAPTTTVNSTGIASSADASIVVSGYWIGTNTLGVYNAAGTPTSLSGVGATNDAFLVKYSTAGTVTWVTRVGAGGQGIVVPTVALDNTIVITGGILSTATSWNVYNQPGTSATVTTGVIAKGAGYVAKYNSAGTAQWIKLAVATAGSPASNFGLGVTTDPGGNVFSTGLMYGTTTLATARTYTVTGQDGYVMKLSPTGTLVWATQIDDITADSYTFAGSVTYDRISSNILVTGSFSDTTNFYNDTNRSVPAAILNARGDTYDTFIVKYSA
jgi:hypothetical protein